MTLKMSEMDLKQRGFIMILIGVFVASSFARFGQISHDGYYYIKLVNVFLGTESLDVVSTPFAYRVIPALLTASLSWIAPPIVVWSVLSLVAGCLWVVVFHKLISEFNSNPTVVFLTTLLLLLHSNVYTYAAMPMLDTFEMLIITSLLLAIKRGYYSDRSIYAAIFVGMFVKETILFVLLFYLLYDRKMTTVLATIVCGLGMAVFRVWWKGNVYQALSFTMAAFEERYAYTIFQVTSTIGLFIVLLAFGLLVCHQRWWSTEQTALYKWLACTLLAFIPLAVIALYFAWFHARFLWPLYLAFGPGLAYVFSAMVAGDEQDAC